MNILLYQHQQQGLHNNQIISVHIMLWLNLLLVLGVNLRNENSRFFDPRQGRVWWRTLRIILVMLHTAPIVDSTIETLNSMTVTFIRARKLEFWYQNCSNCWRKFFEFVYISIIFPNTLIYIITYQQFRSLFCLNFKKYIKRFVVTAAALKEQHLFLIVSNLWMIVIKLMWIL